MGLAIVTQYVFVTTAKVIIISETSNKTSNKNAENKLLPTENNLTIAHYKPLSFIAVGIILLPVAI